MQHVAVSNGMIGVLAQGKGTPILFVHGFPLTHAMWNKQVDAFSRRYRVIAPDLPGFGESHVTGSTMSMEAIADDMHALLHAVFVDQPIVFCGLSMGGYVAWQFFRKYRAQLKALVLCDTKAAADTPEAAAGRLKLAEDILARGSQVALEAMLPRLLSANTAQEHPEIVADVRSMILRTSPASMASALRGLADRPDCTELLGQIDVPTLVLCGQDDQITPAAEMKHMAQAIRGAQFVEVPSAGHLSPLENPDVVNSAIQGFLKTVS